MVINLDIERAVVVERPGIKVDCVSLESDRCGGTADVGYAIPNQDGVPREARIEALTARFC